MKASRCLLFFLAAGTIAASARASVAVPSMVASSPVQWSAFTQSAVEEGDFPALRDRLEERIHAELPAAAIANLDRPVPALAVAQWRFLRETLAEDATALKKVSGGANGKQFLTWLLTNREALDEYLGLTGIIPVQPAREAGIDGWRAIWTAHPEAREAGLWMRVSAACAVVFASPGNGVTANDRFDFYYGSHRAGQLIPYFDRETPFDLALTVHACGRSNDELEWAQDVVPKDKKDQVSVSSYGFSLIAYRGNNYRGVSVQDGRYYDHRGGTLPLIMEYGGVCGAVSTINAAVANAHGVPAFTAGQPGHCAYVWKSDDRTWSGGNFISGWDETASPHTQGFWLGDKSASVNLASEAVRAPGFVQGERLRWLASVWRASDPGAAQEILKAATAVNPLDYGAWQDCIGAALEWQAAPSQTWPAMAAGIIAAFPKFPMAIDDLLGRFEAAKLFPRYGDKERIAYAAAVARALTALPPAEQWNLTSIAWKPWLTRQISGFGLPTKTANDVVEGNPTGSAWKGLSAAERPQVEALFATLLPVVETNPAIAKGVTTVWIGLVAQDPEANARAAAYFRRRLANAGDLKELNIVAEAAFASIRSSPDARADLAEALRQRLESMPKREADQTDALLDLLSRSDFRGAGAIGTWDGGKLAGGGEKTMEWDITRFFAKADDQYALHLNFRWTGGAPLKLKEVRLFENSKEASSDTRAEIADALLKLDAATLRMPAPKPGAHYVVRAIATGGGDSTGEVLCRAEPMATFNGSEWRGVGDWSLKAIKAAPVITDGWHEMEFDASKYVKHPGPIFIDFRYGSYSSPRVMNVRLLVNGREEADDLHSCNPQGGANTMYVLRMPVTTSNAKIAVRALFTEADGYGTVFIRKQAPTEALTYNRAGSSP